MLKRIAAVMVLVLMTACAASAAEGVCAQSAAAPPELTLKEANELLRGVGEVKSVRLSPVNGLWLLELEKDGRKGEAFLDFDKKNVMVGTVFPLAGVKLAGPETAGAALGGGKVNSAAIPLTNSIVMGNPKGSQKLIVFTDPECPYCAKLHAELKKLVAEEPDLAVYVKLFPLASHPQAYTKARVIMGAGSLELLDKAFSGLALPPLGTNDSKEPVIETLALARSLGISGTPTLVLADGAMVKGAMDLTSLKNLLSLHKK
jgi:thiol:disulfide interchange protein DsbC